MHIDPRKRFHQTVGWALPTIFLLAHTAYSAQSGVEITFPIKNPRNWESFSMLYPIQKANG
jgi:hypothetical protein